MAGNVFLLDDNIVSGMTEIGYSSENDLQELIAKYPQLLAGSQIDPDNPRKWIFVDREVGIPETNNGIDRWSLDHLFIDQDSIPTLVEVKRSSDTRIRREVVAQMMDYAANASQYLNVNDLRKVYEERKSDEGSAFLSEIDLTLEDSDKFWDKVSENLHTGYLRLLFVADEIPESLKTVIEFLNNQMEKTEVLGVEVKQYFILGKQNPKLLVSTILGKTAEATRAKTTTGDEWEQEDYLKLVSERSGNASAEVCKRLIKEFEQMGCHIKWGKGKVQPGFTVDYFKGHRYILAAVYTYKDKTTIEIPFYHFREEINDNEKKQEYQKKLNKIRGVNIPAEKLGLRPSFDCQLLKTDEDCNNFFSVYKEILHIINANNVN